MFLELMCCPFEGVIHLQTCSFSLVEWKHVFVIRNYQCYYQQVFYTYTLNYLFMNKIVSQGKGCQNISMYWFSKSQLFMFLLFLKKEKKLCGTPTVWSKLNATVVFPKMKMFNVSMIVITFKLSQVHYIEPVKYPFRSPITLNARRVEPCSILHRKVREQLTLYIYSLFFLFCLKFWNAFFNSYSWKVRVNFVDL